MIENFAKTLVGIGLPDLWARYLNDKFDGLMGVVSVSAYGARGDGVFNDTEAFEEAIATGKSVFVPAGTYKVSHLDLANDNQAIFGEGNTSIITHTDPTQQLFTVSGDNVIIRSLRLNGASSSEANGTYAVLTATASPAVNLTVDSVYITGASSGVGFNNGVKFDGSCHGGKVINCKIERLYGTAAGYGYGVLMGAANGCIISNNQFYGAASRGRHAVYLSSGASYSEVTNNYIESFVFQGINQNSSGASPVATANLIANNILRTCVSGNNATSGSIGTYGHSLGLVIANNQIYTSGGSGIALDVSGETDCYFTTVTGNMILSSYYAGIDVLGAQGAEIVGNFINESSKSASGSYGNIRIVRDATTVVGATNILVSGNHCSGSSFARSAVTVNSSAPAPTGIKLQGNHFSTGTAYIIENTGGLAITVDGWTQLSGAGDAGSILDGDNTSQTFTCTGANLGDVVLASCSAQLQGLILGAEVSATNTVRLTLNNNTGSSQDMGNSNYRILVKFREAA